MSATFDCYGCFAVYFSNFPGPHVCEVCGEVLRERPDGAEPFADVEIPDEETSDTQEAPALKPRLAGAAAPVGGGVGTHHPREQGESRWTQPSLEL